MRSSGTGWPSLYRSGSRISWRRSDLLIRRGALDLESYVLGSQEAQRPLRDEHLARRPALEGKSTGEAAQCPFLGVQVGEADPDVVRLGGAIVATGCGDFIKLKTLGAGSRSGERP